MRYYVYKGADLAVTFEYGRRPVYHGTLGQQVKDLLVAPDSNLGAAGFRFVFDDAPCERDRQRPGGDTPVWDRLLTLAPVGRAYGPPGVNRLSV